MRAFGKSILGVMLLMASMHASAVIIPWTASLDGTQEVPSSGSAGTGSASGSIDTVTGDLDWNISWSGLSGAAVAMHFHLGAPGVNGGVQLNIGAISGLTSPSIGSTAVALTAQQISDVLAGLWYINIHTQTYPGGEIRGQVTVPEPGTLGLLGAGLIGLAWRRRLG